MSKTTKKNKVIPPIPTPIINKPTKKDNSVYFFLLGLGIVLFILYLLFDNVVTFQMILYQMHSAKSDGYDYINYVSYTPSVITFISIVILVFAYGTYFNYAILFSFLSQSLSSKIIWIVIVPLIPLLCFVWSNYQSVDKFMYPNMNGLYNLVNTDPSFKNTNVEINFKKALENKDYSSLKMISNDLPSLAKLTKEQLNEIEEIINVIPNTEIKSAFKNFKKGFTSYNEYSIFYKNISDIFNNSEQKDNQELSLLMKKLKITTYDYKQLKIELLQDE